MKLLEASGLSSWPGGIVSVANVLSAFNKTAINGVKGVEMTKEELSAFLQAFSTQIPSGTDVASGDFLFWGVRIKQNG